MIKSIYFDQWRYLLEVEIDGTKYDLRSDKCIDDTLPTESACYFPKKPFAVPTNAQARATLTTSGDTERLESRFFVENLPGTFTLHFKYSSEDIANPACTPNFLAKISI